MSNAIALADRAELIAAIRSVRDLIDGSQPKDLPGAVIVIDEALVRVGAVL